MNDFEKFIKSQKEAMDTDDFTLEIWESIDKELPKVAKTKVVSIRWISTVAAAVLIMILIGKVNYNERLNPVKYLEQNGINSAHYVASMDEKMSVLKRLQIPVNQKLHFEDILSQLDNLDKEYLEYIEYIKQNGYQEHVGERILQYYNTKIMMLDKIQHQIKEINYYEQRYNKKNETTPLFL